MRITYDPQVDALYIRFVDEPVEVITHRLSEDVAVNYAPDGRIVGIEILDASEYVFPSVQERRIWVHNLELRRGGFMIDTSSRPDRGIPGNGTGVLCWNYWATPTQVELREEFAEIRRSIAAVWRGNHPR
jgi:uncharacterized protein YuzE